ncbi:MAG TPA: hypothetical protein VEA44_19225 [Caulobacter sp.]|nr:hypothetical protein [Caulobacter sp.]
MPSLFGLVLLSFACGALAALAARRRSSAFPATAAALAGGLGGPWLSAALGLQVAPPWALLAGAAGAALVAAGLAGLIPRRR